jgi:AraC-like DNA-binding protein
MVRTSESEHEARVSEILAAQDYRRGVHALSQLRAATMGICDVIPLTAEDDFHFSSRTIMTGSALLVDSQTSALEYDRTPVHVARGGLDHYHVTLCLQGEIRFSSGRRELTLHPGDIFLVDMAQPNRTVLMGAGDDRCRLMALILQRAVLAPRLAHPDSAAGSFLPASHHHAGLLANQFAALWQPAVPEAGSLDDTIDSMVDIVATAVGRAADARGDVERAERHLYRAIIKGHIASNLESGSFSAADLCRRFRIPRASLYRLFEADGGLARYVQEQRLNRALILLVAPASRDKRLIDLAVDLQFSSDSTFVRAFRRKFGLTPGEIRDMAEAWLRERGVVPGPGDLLQQLARRRG